MDLVITRNERTNWPHLFKISLKYTILERNYVLNIRDQKG